MVQSAGTSGIFICSRFNGLNLVIIFFNDGLETGEALALR